MSTNNFEDLNSSAVFTRILLQSGQYSTANSQPPVLQPDAEKVLVELANLFARELVSQASSATQRRQGSSIHRDDVNFVLKHQWPIYDSSAYHPLPEN